MLAKLAVQFSVTPVTLSLASITSPMSASLTQTRSTVIVIETDAEKRAPGYESWWDVPVAEVSELPAVNRARKEFERAVKKERFFL